jgi:holo-[acyl-carrier protein] synthase
MIIGLGIDIVRTHRIKRIWQKHALRFVQRIFTPMELEYCLPKARPELHLAGRFAAKEACLKALSDTSQISWHDMQIHHNGMGRPILSLKNRALALFEQKGGRFLHLSLSHEKEYAVATVIIEN